MERQKRVAKQLLSLSGVLLVSFVIKRHFSHNSSSDERGRLVSAVVKESLCSSEVVAFSSESELPPSLHELVWSESQTPPPTQEWSDKETSHLSRGAKFEFSNPALCTQTSGAGRTQRHG